MVSLAVSVWLIAACGHKTPVYPPELVAPQAISDLRLTASDSAIELRWNRPETYADGRDMDDLGGFVVLRAAQPQDGQLGEFRSPGHDSGRRPRPLSSGPSASVSPTASSMPAPAISTAFRRLH